MLAPHAVGCALPWHGRCQDGAARPGERGEAYQALCVIPVCPVHHSPPPTPSDAEDSSYSSDFDSFLPDDGAAIGVEDDAWLPPRRASHEQANTLDATMRKHSAEEQSDEEQHDEGLLDEGQPDGQPDAGEHEGQQARVHLGIGDGSGDSDYEKALFHALVPIDHTLAPTIVDARRTRERAAAPHTELSAEWVVQAVALATGSSHNPHAGSRQELALLLLRSGLSLHAAADLVGGLQQHLLDLRMVAHLEDLKCASLQHMQRRLRQDVWKYTNVQQLKVPLPRPLPSLCPVFRCVGPALLCLLSHTHRPVLEVFYPRRVRCHYFCLRRPFSMLR